MNSCYSHFSKLFVIRQLTGPVAVGSNFEFLEKYPGMTHRDWTNVVMSFIHDVQTCYGLELSEIFGIVA